MPKMKRAKIVKMHLDELAGVDEGAQAEAGDVILKRRDQPAVPVTTTKRSALTTAVLGHTHLLTGIDDAQAGTTSSERHNEPPGSDSYTAYHSHPWVRTEDGSVLIGEVAGHTHEIATTAGALTTKSIAGARKKLNDAIERHERHMDGSESTSESSQRKLMMEMKAALAELDDVVEKGKAAHGNSTTANGGPNVSVIKEHAMPNTEHEMQIADLKKQLAAAQALANLTDAEKIHRATLPDGERDAFVAKSAAERQEIVKAANEVVHTCADGTLILKSHGELALKFAKQADEALKTAKAEKAARELSELTKRATDALRGLSCSDAAKVALFKAAESIEDDKVRAEAIEACKSMARAEKLAGSMSGVGASNEIPAGEDPLAKFNAGVAAYAEKHSIKDQGVALEKFLGTTEGLALKRAYDATRAYGTRK